MASKKFTHPSRYPVLLLVEGHSDQTFYSRFLEELELGDTCFIHQIQGKDRLEAETKALLNPTNLEGKSAVGILIDSDCKPDSAFQKALGALRQVPEFQGISLDAPGQWAQFGPQKTRWGIWIAGSEREAEIESLAWRACQGDPNLAGLAACVEKFVECADTAGHRLKSPDKVRIGAILSVLNEDDSRLGPGARARKIPLSSPVFDDLRRFLGGLPKPGSSTPSK